MRTYNRDSKNKSGRRDSGKRDFGKFGRRDSGRSGGRDSGRFGRRDSGRSSSEKPEMHRVVCDKCGESCEVPFKPTEGKPVYCRDCFKKEESPRQESRSSYGRPRREFRPRHESSESGQGSDKLAAEFQQINAKLDKILELLSDD